MVTPHTIVSPDLGEVLACESGIITYEPMLVGYYSAIVGVPSIFIFTQPEFSVEPIQFKPNYCYNFSSLTGKKLYKINGYDASVKIKMNFAGRELMKQFLHALEGMLHVNNSFGEFGLSQSLTLAFAEAGDATRRMYKVFLDINEISALFIDERYCGYNSTEITLALERIESLYGSVQEVISGITLGAGFAARG